MTLLPVDEFMRLGDGAGRGRLGDTEEPLFATRWLDARDRLAEYRRIRAEIEEDMAPVGGPGGES